MPENIDALFWLPTPPGDLRALESMLEAAGLPFCGNYGSQERAGLAEYMRATSVDRVEIKALFDRNLVSRLVRLADGEPLPANDLRIGQLACAALAFCIWAEIEIEPAMAFYEYASSDGHEAAAGEIPKFRIVDNFDPEILVAYALGRIDRLPSDLLSFLREKHPSTHKPVGESDFGRKLRKWDVHYLFVLKTIELLRSHKSPVDAALGLTQWQQSDGYGAAAAYSYCLAAMSHRPPKGGMLKQLRSPDSAKVLAGARNANWDIMLLQQFGALITKPGPVWWNLWTDDLALRRVADVMFARGDETPDECLRRFLRDCWGNDANRVYAGYQQFVEVTQNQELRQKQIQANYERVSASIAELEEKLAHPRA